jgi:hypothetical protein
MSRQYGSFLLFMLVGGAVRGLQPLKWQRRDIQNAETARDLLRAICVDLGWPQGAEVWERNEELANFVRRPQLRQVFGQPFHREVCSRPPVSTLYFAVEPTPEGLRPLMAAAERSFGPEAVVGLVRKLEKQPWAKDPALANRLPSIRALFGRYVCPPEDRRTLTRAAELAALDLSDAPAAAVAG